MADRFPSIEDIDNGQTQPNEPTGDLMDGSNEPSDFLSRERAALGADADQFSTPAGNSTTNGDDDDLLGGDSGGQVNGTASQEISDFQSSFPPVSSQNERVAPGGSITGTSPLPSTTNLPYHPAPSAEAEQEPDVIKSWRERRTLAIQERETKAANLKEQTAKQAREAVDDFYENYNKKKERGMEQTRREAEEFLAKREDTASGGGTSWERIARLVDVKKGGQGVGLGVGGGEGKERFRELLLGLGGDEKAPGAKGY